MTTQKQIDANRVNAKLGGVKTEEGKSTSKYNSIKHGILSETVSEYEQSFYLETKRRIEDHFKPCGVLEKVIVDRIGVYYLKLYRVSKAENEYMKSALNPRIVKVTSNFDMDFDIEKTVVEKEGYTPKIGESQIEKLSNTYLRYETAIENRLYKAIHELQKIQSKRKAEKSNPNEEVNNGFVS